jgi:hypothetical protein
MEFDAQPLEGRRFSAVGRLVRRPAMASFGQNDVKSGIYSYFVARRERHLCVDLDICLFMSCRDGRFDEGAKPERSPRQCRGFIQVVSSPQGSLEPLRAHGLIAGTSHEEDRP